MHGCSRVFFLLLSLISRLLDILFLVIARSAPLGHSLFLFRHARESNRPPCGSPSKKAGACSLFLSSYILSSRALYTSCTRTIFTPTVHNYLFVSLLTPQRSFSRYAPHAQVPPFNVSQARAPPFANLLFSSLLFLIRALTRGEVTSVKY